MGFRFLLTTRLAMKIDNAGNRLRSWNHFFITVKRVNSCDPFSWIESTIERILPGTDSFNFISINIHFNPSEFLMDSAIYTTILINDTCRRAGHHYPRNFWLRNTYVNWQDFSTVRNEWIGYEKFTTFSPFHFVWFGDLIKTLDQI